MDCKLLKAIGSERLIEYFNALDLDYETPRKGMIKSNPMSVLMRKYPGMAEQEALQVAFAWISSYELYSPPAEDRVANLLDKCED